MQDLIIYIPSHGYSISDLISVSWLDGLYYIRDTDNDGVAQVISNNSFKISTDDSDDNMVQYTSTITSGFVREDPGSPGTTISGLDHLEGEFIYVTSGGSVVGSGVVSSGSVTITSSVSTYQAGKPYTCKIKTMRIASPQVGDALQGVVKSINRAVVRYSKTENASAGQEYPVTSNAGEEVMTEFLSDLHPVFDDDSRDAIIPVDGGFSTDAYITVKSDDPSPMTIIATVVEFSIDEKR